jgi:hypothetical protein
MERVTFRLKMIRCGFWGLMIYIALSSTVAIALQFGLIPAAKPPVMHAQAEPMKSLVASHVSEVAFAEQFVREYLFWTKGKEELRAARLKPFWKANLDVQGGLDFQQASWNSYARHVNVWQMKERNDRSGITDITVYAETILTNIHHAEEQKRVDRYLLVSMQKAGASYVVVAAPHWVAPPVASLSTEPDRKQDPGEPMNEIVRNQVEKFMKSFWKVYTTGEPQEIAYFYKNNQPIQGLTGILNFKEIRQLFVYQAKGQVRAECDVVFEDLASKTEVISRYSFVLTRERDHWYVVKMGEGEEAL